MKFGKELNLALKILLVFAVVTSVFTILGSLSFYIPIGRNNTDIIHYLKYNLLWIFSTILIILGVCIFIIKSDGKFSLSFLNNPMILLTSGLLIIFDGIVDLLNKVSALLLNIQTYRQLLSLVEDADKNIRNVMISDILLALINLFQILFGLYFVFKKKKNDI